MTAHVLERTRHLARWWETGADGRAHCFLCPRHCRMREGQDGYCRARGVRDGVLVSRVHSAPAAVQVDPIEKKPFHHVLPGARTLSIGTAGCSLGCAFCQNWLLARGRPDDRAPERLPPAQAVALARRLGCRAVAFTYNEPTVWGEYAFETAREARRAGLAALIVTNGYVTREAARDLFAPMDAVNVDLKAITDDLYRRWTLGRLAPVLDTLVHLRHETAAWLEVTHLLIPGLNDAPDHTRRLAAWLVEYLGPDVPLHLTAFHPDHRMMDRPATSPEALRAAAGIARREGLRFVYEGNVGGDGGDTRCPGCGLRLVERRWFEVRADRLRGGACPGCGAAIPGRWSMP